MFRPNPGPSSVKIEIDEFKTRWKKSLSFVFRWFYIYITVFAQIDAAPCLVAALKFEQIWYALFSCH